MSNEWQKGWQDGYNNSSVNSRINIRYRREGDEKHFSGYGGGAKFPDSFSHRAGDYNCGYAEGMITGFSKYATEERIKEICEKEGIIYKK